MSYVGQGSGALTDFPYCIPFVSNGLVRTNTWTHAANCLCSHSIREALATNVEIAVRSPWYQVAQVLVQGVITRYADEPLALDQITQLEVGAAQFSRRVSWLHRYVTQRSRRCWRGLLLACRLVRA